MTMFHQSNAVSSPRHPLGPLLTLHASGCPVRTRLTALVVCAGAMGVLGAAIRLKPLERGGGWSSPPSRCLVPAVTGLPCPTCGMTTAVACTVRGQWLDAIAVQPAGWLLAVVVGATAVLSGYTLVTARAWSVNWYRVSPSRLLLLMLLVVIGAWLFKVVVTLRAGMRIT